MGKASTHIRHVLSIVKTLYNELIEAGVAKECARDILPLCTKTTIHITGTLRDLLGFLNVRCDDHAQKEIQIIATQMGELLEKELPNVFEGMDWRNGLLNIFIISINPYTINAYVNNAKRI